MGLIFTETLDALLDGTKGQTRRVVKEGDEAHIVTSAGGTQWVKPCADLHLQGTITAVRSKNGRIKWALGRTYAVQEGRGKPQVARLEITGIRCERLQSINFDDVIAEGYRIFGKMDAVKARHWYMGVWRNIHKKGEFAWENNPLVWPLHVRMVRNG